MVKFDKHRFPSVHEGIVRAAVMLLEAERPEAAKRYSAGALEAMTAEATAPDRPGDRQQGRGLHYYCACKPDGTRNALHPILRGYCNGKGEPAPSPLTMLESEYRAALALDRAGKYHASMKSLSRAMHMLADICCPPHSCGLTYFSRYAMMHRRYEARAAAVFWDAEHGRSETQCLEEMVKKCRGRVPYHCYADLLREAVPVEGDFWKGSTFSEICTVLANSGIAELPAVLGDDENARDASITRRLVLSISHCAALLAAYDRDAADETLALPIEREPYWLYSADMKTVVSEEPFLLLYEDDGSVTLSTMEGKYLGVTPLGRCMMTEETSRVSVKFRFGREPLMTLYPNGNQNRPLMMTKRTIAAPPRIGMFQSELYIQQICFRLSTKPPGQDVKAVLGKIGFMQEKLSE